MKNSANNRVTIMPQATAMGRAVASLIVVVVIIGALASIIGIMNYVSPAAPSSSGTKKPESNSSTSSTSSTTIITTRTVSESTKSVDHLFSLIFKQLNECPSNTALEDTWQIPWEVTLSNGMNASQPPNEVNRVENVTLGYLGTTNSTYSMIVFSVPNGNYSYSIHPQGSGGMEPFEGRVMVNGQNVTVDTNFIPKSCGYLITSSTTTSTDTTGRFFYALSIRVYRASFNPDQPILINGTVSPPPQVPTRFNITVENPEGETVGQTFGPVNLSTGDYNYTLIPGGNCGWIEGTFTVLGSVEVCGQLIEANTTFSYVIGPGVRNSSSTSSSTSESVASCSSTAPEFGTPQALILALLSGSVTTAAVSLGSISIIYVFLVRICDTTMIQEIILYKNTQYERNRMRTSTVTVAITVTFGKTVRF